MGSRHDCSVTLGEGMALGDNNKWHMLAVGGSENLDNLSVLLVFMFFNNLVLNWYVQKESDCVLKA